jgi:hypothetical protein
VAWEGEGREKEQAPDPVRTNTTAQIHGPCKPLRAPQHPGTPAHCARLGKPPPPSNTQSPQLAQAGGGWNKEGLRVAMQSDAAVVGSGTVLTVVGCPLKEAVLVSGQHTASECMQPAGASAGCANESRQRPDGPTCRQSHIASIPAKSNLEAPIWQEAWVH